MICGPGGMFVTRQISRKYRPATVWRPLKAPTLSSPDWLLLNLTRQHKESEQILLYSPSSRRPSKLGLFRQYLEG